MGEFLSEVPTSFSAIFKCETCGNIFLNKKTKKQHNCLHRNKIENACEYCGKKFLHPDSLAQHIKTVHNIKINADERMNAVKNYLCEDCACFFEKKDRMKHYCCSCSFCGKKFCKPSYRVKHTKAVHEGQKEISHIKRE